MTDSNGQTAEPTAQPEKTPPGPVSRSFAEQLRAAPITTLLIAINTVVFLLAEQQGSTTDAGILLRFGASEQVHVRAGEYWRLVTPMFLHIGWMHFLWNNYFSFTWCARVEGALGKARFLLVYLVSGIGASAASVACHQVISAGASGAVFGIVGATLVLRRRMLPSWRATWQDPPTRSIVITAAIWMAIGLTPLLQMDNYAHLGGLIVGGALTWLMTSRPAPALAWALSAAFFLALVAVAVWPARPSASQAEKLFGVAAAYYQGKPYGQSDWHAARFAEKACSAGNDDACGLFGWLESAGRGVSADPQAGLSRIREACTRGSAWSCSLLQAEPKPAVD